MSTPSKRKRSQTAEIPPKSPASGALKQPASAERGPDTPKLAAPPGFSHKYGLPKRDAIEKSAIDDTAYPSSYKVKQQFAETAQGIFRKHGDIVADCLFDGTLQMDMLHSTYVIYEKLRNSKFSYVTLAELESMRIDVSDLVKAKLKVGWLAMRLDEIYEAKQCVERSPLMDEDMEKNKKCIERLEKELSLWQHELSASKIEVDLLRAKTETILQTFLEAKEKASRFSWKSSKDESCATLSKPSTKVYKVKEEFESAVQVIISNQGDIVANCLFEGSLRCHLLESACAIYLKMEKMSLKDTTLDELEAVRKDVLDLEKAQVDVSWVSEGINGMYEAKKSLESPIFIENLQKENRERIQEIEEEIKWTENMIREVNENLVAEKARTATLEQNLLDAKKKVSRFFRKSLVDGI